MPTQKYTLDLPRLVPEVECLITVDLVAQLVGGEVISPFSVFTKTGEGQSSPVLSHGELR